MEKLRIRKSFFPRWPVIPGLSLKEERMLYEYFEKRLYGEAIRLLNNIKCSAERMAKPMDEQFRLSRMGKRAQAETSTDRLKVLNEVSRELVHEKSQANITVHPMGKASVDESRKRRVFQNLISNGLKFSSGRERPVVEMGVKSDMRMLFSYVRDNGAGLKWPMKNKLFGVFQGLYGADEFERTGMDLAIAQRIMQRHGGKSMGREKGGRGCHVLFAFWKVNR